ncbi:MAG: ABC transporter ATP-binding protein [Actinobacteria bacterium 69-20]|jgi:ABC-type branched-subunit amino acid transport system ATPase component|nr:ABC transporter ATP-binding protein [Actinomycetota bacterium]OJV26881.1 MAG: ABC transporter ATP-binding protein [Actinobacteria bacterium 69-20]
MSAPAPVLTVTDVVAGYVPGADVLNGLSLEVHKGEIVTLIGPNGAGKSTGMKLIFGLLRPRRGTVHLRDRLISGLEPHSITRLGMAYVPQVANVFPSLTVMENLEIGALKHAKAATRLTEVLDLFPRLAQRRRQVANTMSGGERQMLAIGRALMSGPEVLLLDEPSAALSPALVDVTFELIRDVNKMGVTVLMVEQNASRALEISDRGYVLEGGATRLSGPAASLLENPEVVDLYLGGGHVDD